MNREGTRSLERSSRMICAHEILQSAMDQHLSQKIEETTTSSVSTFVINLALLSAFTDSSSPNQIQFLSALRHSSHIAKIVLDFHVSHEGPRRVGPSYSDCEPYVLLGAAMGAMLNLQTLQVSLNDVHMLQPIVSVLQGTTQVRRLVWCCSINQIGLEGPMAQQLANCFHAYKRLSSAKVDCLSGDGMALVCNMLCYAPNLWECEFSSLGYMNLELTTPMQIQAITNIMQQESVCEVRLKGITIANAAAVDAFCNKVSKATTNTTTSLHILVISKASFDLSKQRFLGEALVKANIHKLILDDCDLSSDFYGGMAEQFSSNKSLEFLSFEGCSINGETTDDGLVSLLREIPHSKTLQTFYPPSCRWTASMDVAWGFCLANTESLKDVSVVGQSMIDLFDPLAKTTMALCDKSTLECLRIDLFEIGEDTYRRLAQAISTNTSLVSLELRFCQWSPHMLVDFLRQINNCKQLKSVVLQVSKLDHPSMKAQAVCDRIIETAKQNYTLTCLRIISFDDFCSPLEWQLNQNLQLITCLNGRGRGYMTVDHTCRKQGTDLLAAVSNDLSSVFFHLRENPLLCETFLTVNHNDTGKPRTLSLSGTASKHVFAALCSVLAHSVSRSCYILSR